MTLIISAATSDVIVQVSDRRLSFGKTIKSDAASKGAITIAEGRRFVTSFTGLSQAPGFNRIKLLRDCAHEFVALPAGTRTLSSYTNLLESRFQNHFASSAWLTRNASKDSNALYIFATAFDDGGRPTYGLISNRSTLGLSNESGQLTGFKSTVASHPGILIISQFNLVDAKDRGELQRLADAQTSAEGLLGKAVDVMRKSTMPENISVGRNLNTIVIPRDPAIDVSFDYFTDQPSNKLFLPNQTIEVAEGPMSIFDIQITDPNDVFIPQGHPNDSCWCGSGKKMRKCHGKRGNPGGWRLEIKKTS